MSEFVGKEVKIFFKTGICVEGVVSSWNDNEARLSSGEKELIIFSPYENIEMVKVDVEHIEEYTNVPLPQTPPVQTRSQEQFKGKQLSFSEIASLKKAR